MPDPDPVWTAAMQLVWDEHEAQRAESDGDTETAEYIRRHAVGHVRSVLALAEERGTPTARATVLPDGSVVVAVMIPPS